MCDLPGLGVFAEVPLTLAIEIEEGIFGLDPGAGDSYVNAAGQRETLPLSRRGPVTCFMFRLIVSPVGNVCSRTEEGAHFFESGVLLFVGHESDSSRIRRSRHNRSVLDFFWGGGG